MRKYLFILLALTFAFTSPAYAGLRGIATGGPVTGPITGTGSDGQVIFNSSGTLTGNSGITYLSSSNTLTLTGDIEAVNHCDENGNNCFEPMDVGNAVLNADYAAGAFVISNASYDSKSFDISSEELEPRGMFIKPDGSKLFVIGINGDAVYQYTMSVVFDISTASYDSKSADVSGEVGEGEGVFIRADGARMFVVDSVSDKVFQYTLSTPWDMSTSSYDSKSFSISEDLTPKSLVLKADGTQMLIVGATNDKVFQYTLSTPWDISTASYDTKSLDVSGEDIIPQGSFLTADGTRTFVIGNDTDTIYQYSLGVAFDISTASYDTKSFSINSEDDQPRDMWMKADGTKFYIIGKTTDTVYQYSIGVGQTILLDITGAGNPATLSIPASSVVGRKASGNAGTMTAAETKTMLGLVIGTDVQAFDTNLEDLAALAVVADNEIAVGTGAGTYAFESGATLLTSIGAASSSTGADTQVIFNSSGTLTGDAGLTYNDSTNALTVAGNALLANLTCAPDTEQAITAVTNTISSSNCRVEVTPDADYVMTSTPTIAAGVDGQILLLHNEAAGITIALQDDSILAGSDIFLGGAEATIRPQSTMMLHYDSGAPAIGWHVMSNPNSASAGASAELIPIRNVSGSGISAGALVYITGYNVGQARITVDLADADGAGTFPAVGFATTAIGNNANGEMAVIGDLLSVVDTSTASAGDGIWMSSAAGGVTFTKPTTDEIQQVGVVTRSNASGNIFINGAGRINDVPIDIVAETIALGTTGVTSGVATFAGSASGTVTVTSTAAAGSGTLTLPDATDTLVGKATTDILTNKSIDSSNNTLTNISWSGDGATGTDGTIPTFSAAGAPVFVPVGTSGQVLTSNGVGTEPTFQATGAGDVTASGSPLDGEIAIWTSGTDIEGDAAFAFNTTTNALEIEGTTSGTVSIVATAIAGTGTLTLPVATDTLTGKATTDTFTNKSISLTTNTLTGTLAELNTAVSDATIVDLDNSDSLTNKSMAAGSNTFTGFVWDTNIFADGTDGQIPTFDASGEPAFVATGTATQVLTSNGAGTAPTFQAAAGGTGSLVLLATATASASSSIVFTSSAGIDSTYDEYIMSFNGVTQAGDGGIVLLKTSTNGGTTYDGGATDYVRALGTVRSNTGSMAFAQSSGDTSIQVTSALGNAAGENAAGVCRLHQPSNTSLKTLIMCDTVAIDNDGFYKRTMSGGFRDSAADVDAIELTTTGTTFTIGEFKLYGVEK